MQLALKDALRCTYPFHQFVPMASAQKPNFASKKKHTDSQLSPHYETSLFVFFTLRINNKHDMLNHTKFRNISLHMPTTLTKADPFQKEELSGETFTRSMIKTKFGVTQQTISHVLDGINNVRCLVNIHCCQNVGKGQFLPHNSWEARIYRVQYLDRIKAIVYWRPNHIFSLPCIPKQANSISLYLHVLLKKAYWDQNL